MSDLIMIDDISTRTYISELFTLVRSHGGDRKASEALRIPLRDLRATMNGTVLPSSKLLRAMNLKPVAGISYRYNRTKTHGTKKRGR